MLRTLLLLLGLVCTAACVSDDTGPGDEPADYRVEVPEAPAEGEGVQLVMSEWTVPSGTELMWCWVADWVPDRDYFVNSFESFQAGVGGHHLVALGATVPFDAGYSFDCTNVESMSALEPLVLPGSDSSSQVPEGMGVRVNAGAQVIIQSHYINYTNEDMLVRDVVHLGFTPEGEDVTELSYIILNHGALDLPPGDAEVSVSCSLPSLGDSYFVTTLFGHMHELGTAMSIALDAGEGPETLYAIDDWEVEFRDLPPLAEWSVDAPLELRPGDDLSVDCSYANSTGGSVTFPEEMCTAVALYHPASPEGIILCSED